MNCGVLHKQHAIIQPHALNTSFAQYLTKSYTAYADSMQMDPFTSCEKSAQLGERPFSCEAICYTREIAIHPSVSDVIHH